MSSGSYDALIGEFVALGGEAGNVRFGSGPRGAGMFAVDPGQPVKMRVPRSLLVARDHLFLENGAVRIAPESPLGGRERDFVARYYQDFCWAAAAPGIAAQIAAFQALPPEIAQALGKDFGLPRFMTRVGEADPFRRFLQSRAIRIDGTPTMMPMLDLINHDAAGVCCSFTDGVSVTGSFSGEVLVRYRSDDAFGIFESWGFICSEPFAYSFPLMVPWQGRAIGVDRFDWRELGPAKGLEVTGKLVAVSRVLIGDRTDPARPKARFIQRLAETGVPDTGALFAEIRALNRAKLEAFARLTAKAQGPAARLLEQVCADQMEALDKGSV